MSSIHKLLVSSSEICNIAFGSARRVVQRSRLQLTCIHFGFKLVGRLILLFVIRAKGLRDVYPSSVGARNATSCTTGAAGFFVEVRVINSVGARVS